MPAPFHFCSENMNIFDSFIRGLNDMISERRGGALRRRGCGKDEKRSDNMDDIVVALLMAMTFVSVSAVPEKSLEQWT